VARVLHDVRGELARHDFAVAAIAFSESQALGLLTGGPPDDGHAGPVGHTDRHASHFHRLTLTRVPLPGADSISNSFMSRRDPERPSPKPVPVEYPSRSASAMSAIPGPES